MNIILAAGGTGGHMVPAHALAAELKARGHGVMLITDERGARYPGLFKDVPVHILPAGRLGGGPLGLLKAMRSVLRGGAQARALYREHRARRGGRLRRLSGVSGLARGERGARCRPCCTSRMPCSGGSTAGSPAKRRRSPPAMPRSSGSSRAHRGKTVLVGNPVREAVVRLGELPFPPFDDSAPLKILVTGGSQGATILGEVVPEGLGLLPSRAAPAPAGRPAMPRRRYRGGPRALCRARHSRRAADLYRRHARAARRCASRHRAAPAPRPSPS